MYYFYTILLYHFKVQACIFFFYLEFKKRQYFIFIDKYSCIGKLNNIL